MKSLPKPDTLQVYYLVKQTGMTFTGVGTGAPFLGTGFFLDRTTAEHHRTLETLKLIDKSILHVYELEVNNPA